MRNYRLLLIRWRDTDQMWNIMSMLTDPKHLAEFRKLNIKPEFPHDPNMQEFMVWELYGYDGKKKWSTTTPTETNLKKMYQKIREMPLGRK